MIDYLIADQKGLAFIGFDLQSTKRVFYKNFLNNIQDIN